MGWGITKKNKTGGNITGENIARKNSITNGITFKIMMIFAVCLIPIYAMLVISLFSYINSLEVQAIKNTEALLDITMNSLESEISRVDEYLTDVFNGENEWTRQLLIWSGSDNDMIALVNLNKDAVSWNNTSSYSEACFLYVEEEDILLLHDAKASSSAREEIEDYLKENVMRDKQSSWNITTIGSRHYLYHILGYNGFYMGTMIDLNDIMETLSNQLTYEKSSITYLNHEGDAEASRLSVTERIHGMPGCIRIELDSTEVRGKIPVLSRIFLFTCICLLVLMPALLAWFIVRLIINPLKILENGLKRQGMGDSGYRIPRIKAADEFLNVNESFNHMADEIRELKIQSYEDQLEREQMQLQNLLLQIRPHFLLNFFNQIFSMAELEKYDSIKKSCRYLAQFFRYLFRSERIATLKSELDLVSAYLELMEERYLGCFEVEMNIDESLLQYRVPPLIVHNFVENIFKYAVSEGTIITIGISLQLEGDYVVITVSDDGPGMEEETIEMIRNNKPVEKTDGTHIGIYNSAYRLKKLCGEESVLDIRSQYTEGTTVYIKLKR